MKSISFEDYADKYETLHMERENGILTVTLHNNGSPFVLNATAHSEFASAFADIGSDVENKVVILTGTGDKFCAELDMTTFENLNTPQGFDQIYREGTAILRNLLEIPMPMIAAINGPALIHSELALCCDIVLASDNTVFQDAVHILYGVVPGDGVHVLWQEVLGSVRARYFLLTGQTLSAQEAKNLGAVNEVLPQEQLLSRAKELAQDLVKLRPMTLRYTRQVLTQRLKRLVQEGSTYGLAAQGFALMDLNELHN